MGTVPDEEAQTLSCTVNVRARGQCVSKAASIAFVIHNARDGSTRNMELSLSGTTLPTVYLM